MVALANRRASTNKPAPASRARVRYRARQTGCKVQSSIKNNPTFGEFGRCVGLDATLGSL